MKKKKVKVIEKCMHIGGKWKDTPTGRKVPNCMFCPDHPDTVKKGRKPGDEFDVVILPKKKKKIKILKKCVHIGGKWKDTPEGRKDPKCVFCPENENNIKNGKKPGDEI